MPDKLHPYIGTGCKEEPMNRDEQETNHVRCEGDEYKDHRKSLKYTNTLITLISGLLRKNTIIKERVEQIAKEYFRVIYLFNKNYFVN